MKFVIISIYISCCALGYSVYILNYIFVQDAGSASMQEIANTIVEGSEGFFIAQYGTIFK